MWSRARARAMSAIARSRAMERATANARGARGADAERVGRARGGEWRPDATKGNARGNNREKVEEFLHGHKASGSGESARGALYAERRYALEALSGIDPGSRLQLALAKIAMYDAKDELGVFEEEEVDDT